MKKLLLGLGAVVSVIAPIATVVACGSGSGDKGTPGQTPTQTGTAQGTITTTKAVPTTVSLTDIQTLFGLGATNLTPDQIGTFRGLQLLAVHRRVDGIGQGSSYTAHKDSILYELKGTVELGHIPSGNSTHMVGLSNEYKDITNQATAYLFVDDKGVIEFYTVKDANNHNLVWAVQFTKATTK